MGTCGAGEHKGKKKDKNNKPVEDHGDKKTNGDDEIKEIKDSIRLRCPPKKTNLTTTKYKYKLIDLSTVEEYKNEIDGDTTIQELLNSLKLRALGDFIIEFENNLKISYEKINETFNNIVIEIFNKDIPEEIKMNYSYKGLDIPESMDDIINEYIEANKIIGNAILDNDEYFYIITYEKENKLLNPYSFKRAENEELIKFNLFTLIVMPRDIYTFQGVKQHMTQIELY